MPRLPRRDGLERREALLDAALRCFTKKGVLRTGIEDIRLAAKASPSSVYHHFAGLDGVTIALLERTFTRLFAHLTARVLATSSAEGAVLALVRGHLEWCLAHPDEARFMYQATGIEHVPRLAKSLQARKAALLAGLAAHLAPFVARGELPRWPVPQLDVVLLGPSHEALRRHFAGADFAPRWMLDTLPRLAWQGVSNEAGRRTRKARRP